MSKSYLDPKTVDPDAWKSWAKDTLAMIRRVGAFGLIGLPALLLGVSMSMASLVHGSGFARVLSIPFSVAIGLFFMAITYRMMSRARRGEEPAPMADIAGGTYDVIQCPQWSVRTLKSTLIFIGVLLALLFILIMLASAAADPQSIEEASKKDPTILDTAMGVLFHMTVWVWAMRPKGLMGLSYFFQVREGVDVEISSKLETLGRSRNVSIDKASGMLLLVGVFAIFFAPALGYIGYALINLMAMFMAGVNICAWHDIYDPDEGLAVKQKQYALELGRVAA